MLEEAAEAAEALGADPNEAVGTPHVEILPQGKSFAGQ
jgi:hypothetical protein